MISSIEKHIKDIGSSSPRRRISLIPIQMSTMRINNWGEETRGIRRSIAVSIE